MVAPGEKAMRNSGSGASNGDVGFFDHGVEYLNRPLLLLVNARGRRRTPGIPITP
jgi:hypothetical protein